MMEETRWLPMVLLAFYLLAMPVAETRAESGFRIEVLMLGDVRKEPVAGFVAGLADFGIVDGKNAALQWVNTGGRTDRLLPLAREIAGRRPDVAVAAGGVEADALRQATDGTDIPVVFLAVASAVERGLVAGMKSSGNNLTGIDTNDAELTAKRLWFVKKMMPGAKRVLIPVIPSITPAVQAAEIAMEAAGELRLSVEILEAETSEEMARQVATYDFSGVDVIYIGLAAPVWQIEKSVFFPVSAANGIPIMGVNRADLSRGAMAAYACSRYASGRQAARLVAKIRDGADPSALPVETPETLEFVINRWVAERLGIQIASRVWRMADAVVDLPIE